MIEADHHPSLHADFGKFLPKLASYVNYLFAQLYVRCRALHRITLLATVSRLLFPDGDPCGPRIHTSAMCHVRAALSVTDLSPPPAPIHGMSCSSAYATLSYR